MSELPSKGDAYREAERWLEMIRSRIEPVALTPEEDEAVRRRLYAALLYMNSDRRGGDR